MKQKMIARPLANFLNRVSIDREVKQKLLVILDRSKFACDITAFANELGYIFSESDLHDALGAILSPRSNAYEADLSDEALDGVVGGGTLVAFPADLHAAFGDLQFGTSLSSS
ncbi:Nif11-like leader peptide family natural product precursor [Nisaea denitrificans]|uniref:Nif11-like leader peptide family natural product precursor n=1 Tax=Nisaea denitrificans TaxID=390877 RepID=UPI00040ABD02|nr:Nif11-like leader peptide family natural product precursor [Nisaea denitrificans]